MSIKTQLIHELDSLSEDDLQQVAEYLAFIKFRSKLKPANTLDRSRLAELYAEFEEEDSELAEQGIADYANGLSNEDSR